MREGERKIETREWNVVRDILNNEKPSEIEIWYDGPDIGPISGRWEEKEKEKENKSISKIKFGMFCKHK